MLASAAVSAYSQKKNADYQADIANYNADVAENSANDAINRGNADAAQQRARSRQLAGTQTATLAASGVDLGGGTAVDIFSQTAGMGELDALTSVNNAQRQAYGLQTQAAGQRSQASAYTAFGNQQAGMTLLNGAMGAYGGFTKAGGDASSWFKTSQGASSNNMFSDLQNSSYGSNSYTF
ncbi:hypothetical protein VRC35_11190 [Erwinia aphidicola]|uniref:hypothetical protein n=1 Tax=Erwinia aphidicola TaxID=68334 RepID=UPI0030D5B153